MKLPSLRLSSILTKTLATISLGGLLFLAGAPTAKASTWEECHRRVNYTEWRYHRAVEHFGPYSHEARYWAHERAEAVRHCPY